MQHKSIRSSPKTGMRKRSYTPNSSIITVTQHSMKRILCFTLNFLFLFFPRNNPFLSLKSSTLCDPATASGIMVGWGSSTVIVGRTRCRTRHKVPPQGFIAYVPPFPSQNWSPFGCFRIHFFKFWHWSRTIPKLPLTNSPCNCINFTAFLGFQPQIGKPIWDF